MADYVEADPRARLYFLGGIVVLLGAGIALWLHASPMPQASGSEPAAWLQGAVARALRSALAATAFHALITGLVLWAASRAVASGQWPPRGMAMPFRERVRPITSPALVWAGVATVAVLQLAVVLMFWWHYGQLQGLLEMVQAAPVRP